MKCLKEPLSRLANHEDEARGAFFEQRFKSIAILDEEALLATAAYMDLKPVAAGLAEVPEASAHTSIKARVEHVKAAGRLEEVIGAVEGPAGRTALAGGEAEPIRSGERRAKSRHGVPGYLGRAGEGTGELKACTDRSVCATRGEDGLSAGVHGLSDGTGVGARSLADKSRHGVAGSFEEGRSSSASPDPEAGLWLCPVEDRRAQGGTREGMLDGLSLGRYLQLVDFTGRLLRAGKATISAEVAAIFVRLRTSSEAWHSRMTRLRNGNGFGRFFAAGRKALQAAAEQIGVRKLANLAGSAVG